MGWAKKGGGKGRALSPQVQTENAGNRRDLGVSSMCQRHGDRGTAGHLVYIPILCSIAVWECFPLKHAPSCVCLSVCTITNKLRRTEWFSKTRSLLQTALTARRKLALSSHHLIVFCIFWTLPTFITFTQIQLRCSRVVYN